MKMECGACGGEQKAEVTPEKEQEEEEGQCWQDGATQP